MAVSKIAKTLKRRIKLPVTKPAMGKPSKSEAKANKRGLKAANKPTNKTGSKQDRADRNFYQDKSNFIKNSDPLRPNRVRGGSLGAMKKYGDLGVATAKLSPKQAAFRKEVTEDLNKKRRGKK